LLSNYSDRQILCYYPTDYVKSYISFRQIEFLFHVQVFQSLILVLMYIYWFFLCFESYSSSLPSQKQIEIATRSDRLGLTMNQLIILPIACYCHSINSFLTILGKFNRIILILINWNLLIS